MYSYVCVLSTNDYLDGVLVLNENLKRLKSKYPLLCLISQNINDETRHILDEFEIKYKVAPALDVNGIDAPGRWKFTFDKLNIFNLTEYEKIVYLDSDFLILENLDHLFDIKKFAMVCDATHDHKYFCSALMVIMPNKDDYNGLVNLFNKKNEEHAEGIGDQDIINEYFNNIFEISLEYNFIKGIKKELITFVDEKTNELVTKHVCKDYYGTSNPVIIHYFGELKPFMLDKEFDDIYCDLYFEYLNYIRDKKKTIK